MSNSNYIKLEDDGPPQTSGSLHSETGLNPILNAMPHLPTSLGFGRPANPSDYQMYESPARAPDDGYSIPILNPGESHRASLTKSAEVAERAYFVKDLDVFLQDVYFYFEGKGFWPLIVATIMSALTSAFLILLFGFLTTFLNYDVLFGQNDLGGAMADPKLGVVGLILFCFFWLIWVAELLLSLFKLRKLRKVRRFYLHNLNITDQELQTVEWSVVSQRILTVPRLCLAKTDWTELDIANRLLRRENFLIALLNRNVFDLSIPFLSAQMTVFTNPIYWAIRLCVFPFIFEGNEVKPDVLHARADPALQERLVEQLNRRMRRFGIAALVLSPFVFLYLAAYTFFDYGREIRNSPRDLSTRTWSLLAQWKFREFNELPHTWQRRLRLANGAAFAYVNQFHNIYVTAVARFFAFAAGSLLLVFVIFGFIDDGLLQNDILGPFSGIWIIGVLGLVTAAAISLIPKEDHVFDPRSHLEQVREHTHYMPSHWRNQEHSYRIYQEFLHLFEYRVVFYLKEVATVLLAPFTLLITLPRSSRRIISFFSNFTANLPGVGHVVVWATFDIEHFGNPRYGAPTENMLSASSASASSASAPASSMEGPAPGKVHKAMMTRQGKMEKSFLTFKANNPAWKPDPTGQQFLLNLHSHLVQATDGQPAGFSSLRSSTGDRGALTASRDGILKASSVLDPALREVLTSSSRDPLSTEAEYPATMTWPPPEALENSARIHYDLTCSLSTLQDHYYNSSRKRT